MTYWSPEKKLSNSFTFISFSVVVVVVVVVEGSLVPSMRKTGPEGHYTVNP